MFSGAHIVKGNGSSGIPDIVIASVDHIDEACGCAVEFATTGTIIVLIMKRNEMKSLPTNVSNFFWIISEEKFHTL